MRVLQMSPEALPEVGSEANVVQFVSAVQGEDTVFLANLVADDPSVPEAQSERCYRGAEDERVPFGLEVRSPRLRLQGQDVSHSSPTKGRGRMSRRPQGKLAKIGAVIALQGRIIYRNATPE